MPQLYEILLKKQLNASTHLMNIYCPPVAKKCEPGQFVMLKATDKGERIPLTIADFDRSSGSVTVIFQAVGATTTLLSRLEVGDKLDSFTGPLGLPSKLDGLKKVAVVGGGVGCAIAFPQAKKLFSAGAEVDLIAGFRNKDLVILEEEMRAVSTNFYLTTDDGSYGEKGLVTDRLKTLIESGRGYDEVIAIGPVIMMKFVCLLTKKYDLPTTVSLNPLMIDGTGMCGGCRVSVGGITRFACVEGPEFDGHQVDFDELAKRNAAYRDEEKDHLCRLNAAQKEGV